MRLPSRLVESPPLRCGTALAWPLIALITATRRYKQETAAKRTRNLVFLSFLLRKSWFLSDSGAQSASGSGPDIALVWEVPICSPAWHRSNGVPSKGRRRGGRTDVSRADAARGSSAGAVNIPTGSSPIDSDSTVANAVDTEATPIGSVKQRVSLPHYDPEPPLRTEICYLHAPPRRSVTLRSHRTGPEKRWISDVAFSGVFDRRHAIAPDSHKTYGNLERRTRAEKRVSFRGALGRHLSVL
jgi:hypothetical protein